MMNLLLSPAEIGGLNLKNRVGMSPMCTYEVKKKDGIPTPFHFTHYGSKAIGQVGLVIIEATAVDPDGRITDYDLGLWNDDQIDQFKQLIDHIHSLGSKVGIQLAHAGRKAKHAKRPISSTDEPFNDSYQSPHTLSTQEVSEVIHAFKEAARRADQAGVDMIEIHGAHGYLINQFLEPATNNRTDHYGGSLENRFNLLKEIIKETKSVTSLPLWVRLSASAYLPESDQNSINDWQTVAKWLEDLDVRCLDISTGGVVNKKPNIDIREGYQVPFAEAIKRESSIDVATVGLMQSPELCEHVLKTNAADFILQGRALLRESNWPIHAAKVLGVDSINFYNDSYRRGFSI